MRNKYQTQEVSAQYWEIEIIGYLSDSAVLIVWSQIAFINLLHTASTHSETLGVGTPL